MRTVLLILAGALGMFIIMKVLAVRQSGVVSNTTARLKELAMTNQAYNLLKTNEFRELVKTNQFRNFVKSLAQDQVGVLATTMAI